MNRQCKNEMKGPRIKLLTVYHYRSNLITSHCYSGLRRRRRLHERPRSKRFHALSWLCKNFQVWQLRIWQERLLEHIPVRVPLQGLRCAAIPEEKQVGCWLICICRFLLCLSMTAVVPLKISKSCLAVLLQHNLIITLKAVSPMQLYCATEILVLCQERFLSDQKLAAEIWMHWCLIERMRITALNVIKPQNQGNLICKMKEWIKNILVSSEPGLTHETKIILKVAELSGFHRVLIATSFRERL